jgi:hypothetical protein
MRARVGAWLDRPRKNTGLKIRAQVKSFLVFPKLRIAHDYR